MKRAAKRRALRGAALAAAAAVCVAACPAANAANTVNAAGAVVAPKEEVIYVNLGNDGGVLEAYAVNSFDVAEAGLLTDYGSYSAVSNLTTAAPLAYANGRVSMPVEPGRFYYQGTLETVELPWSFSIGYFLDGGRITAEELSGRSGALQIALGIRKNPRADLRFFENFALQITVTLDAAACSNIRAEGATIANAGSSKSLAFTLLPGTEKTLSIRADVRDFHMPGIQINGIPLSLDIELPDTSELTGRFGELQDGVAELDDGASGLLDGVGKLRDGTGDLYDGAGSLYDGLGTLRDGAAALGDGAMDLLDGVGELDDGAGQLYDGALKFKKGFLELEQSGSELTQGSSQMGSGIGRLASGLGAYADAADTVIQSAGQLAALSGGIKTGLEGLAALASTVYQTEDDARLLALLPTLQEEARSDPALFLLLRAYMEKTARAQALSAQLSALSGQYAQFDQGMQRISAGLQETGRTIAQLSQAVAAMAKQYGEFDEGVHEYVYGVYDLYMGYADLHGGIKELAEGTGALLDGVAEFSDGARELSGGAGELYDGAGNLRDGIAELRDGVQELCDGTGELADGTGRFREKTADMDRQVDDALDEVTGRFQNDGFEPVSFLSERNRRVNAVQFVMKTPGVSEPVRAEAERPAGRELTFWQKLCKLFGLYREEE